MERGLQVLGWEEGQGGGAGRTRGPGVWGLEAESEECFQEEQAAVSSVMVGTAGGRLRVATGSGKVGVFGYPPILMRPFFVDGG